MDFDSVRSTYASACPASCISWYQSRRRFRDARQTKKRKLEEIKRQLDWVARRLEGLMNQLGHDGNQVANHIKSDISEGNSEEKVTSDILAKDSDVDVLETSSFSWDSPPVFDIYPDEDEVSPELFSQIIDLDSGASDSVHCTTPPIYDEYPDDNSLESSHGDIAGSRKPVEFKRNEGECFSIKADWPQAHLDIVKTLKEYPERAEFSPRKILKVPAKAYLLESEVPEAIKGLQLPGFDYVWQSFIKNHDTNCWRNQILVALQQSAVSACLGKWAVGSGFCARKTIGMVPVSYMRSIITQTILMLSKKYSRARRKKKRGWRCLVGHPIDRGKTKT